MIKKAFVVILALTVAVLTPLALAQSSGHHRTDINGDGKVNVIDLQIVAADWRTQTDIVLPDSGLEVLDNATLLYEDSNAYLFGEVANTTAESVTFVSVATLFTNDADAIVGSDSTYTRPHEIPPGRRACFTSYDRDLSEEPTSYTTATEASTGSQLEWLTILNHGGNYTGTRHTIAGQIRNDHDFAVRFPQVAATFYTAEGDVFDCDSDYATGGIDNILQPGESAIFEVRGRGMAEIAGWMYSLTAYGTAYTDTAISEDQNRR